MHQWLVVFVGVFVFGIIHTPVALAQKLPQLPGTIHLHYRLITRATPLTDAERVVFTRDPVTHTETTVPGYQVGRRNLTGTYEPSADYWSDGADRVCWTTDLYARSSAVASAKTWIAVTEDQRGVYVTYAPRKTGVAPRLRSNFAESAQAGIPCLGFAQRRNTEVEATNTYDNQGRLARLQRGELKGGGYIQEYTFSDYVAVAANTAIPRIVVEKDALRAERTPDAAYTVYVLRSWDTKPAPDEWYTRQRLPAGAIVTDYRYALNAKIPLVYRYTVKSTVDSESRAQFAAKKQAMRSVPSTIDKPRKQTNGVGMALVHLPGGSFLMGQKEIAEPVHRVRIASFSIGQYEVTNAQFEQFKKRPRPVESTTDKQPVTRVTYAEAVAYCQWLGKKTGGYYRLPTEAEWEYAARGGLVQKRYPWGDVEATEGLAALGQSATKTVGSYFANGFGLFDMAGNVAEWVSDWYDDDYYKHNPTSDPQGPRNPSKLYGAVRIVRGGHFGMEQGECALRIMISASPRTTPKAAWWNDRNHSDGTGFRVVKEDR